MNESIGLANGTAGHAHDFDDTSFALLGHPSVPLLAAALATLPVAAVTEGVPPVPAGAHALLATAGLALLGTLAPFTLFAYGQARVSPEIAGAFLNLEPLVGAAAGAAVFGDPVGMAQAAGGAAVLTGIALSGLPLLARGPGRQGGAVGGHAPAASADPARTAISAPGGAQDCSRRERCMEVGLHDGPAPTGHAGSRPLGCAAASRRR